MQTPRNLLVTLVALASSFFTGFASAESAPPESTSKVKRVLLYSKVGGWVSVDGIQETKTVIALLAKSKGFVLDTLTDDTQLTPEFLKKYQVIIWNNNTDGRGSVPTFSAREAVANYVNQGGGWLLIRYAGDHLDSWPQLREMLGTKFVIHRKFGNADFVPDSSAKGHPELKHVVSAIPGTIRLNDIWFHFDAAVRPLPGATVLFTAANGDSGVLTTSPNSNLDLPVVWARTIGKGKLFYSSPGHGEANVTAQADSAIPKLYWQSLRWLAGDFQNGCTDPNSPRFDSSARIEDGSCAALSARLSRQPISKAPQIVARAGQRIRLDFPHEGAMQITLRDMRGSVLSRQSVVRGVKEFQVDAALKPGIYHLEARSGKSSAPFRLVLN